MLGENIQRLLLLTYNIILFQPTFFNIPCDSFHIKAMCLKILNFKFNFKKDYNLTLWPKGK